MLKSILLSNIPIFILLQPHKKTVMLLQFTIQNFLSFKDKVVLDMQAGTIKEHQDHYFTPFFERNLKLLKSVGIYGANSNGKSNLIKAMAFMRQLVLDSSKASGIDTKIDVEPFLLSTTTEFEPSFFEIIFYIGDTRYKYGFTVTKDQIETEWLASTVKSKEEYIYLRNGQEYNFDKKFRQEFKNQLELLTKLTRNNTLFISILTQFNIAIGETISNWFLTIIVALDTDQKSWYEATANLFKDIKYRQLLNDIIHHSGLGIEGIEEYMTGMLEKSNYSREVLGAVFKKELESLIIRTRHTKYDANGKPADYIYFDMNKHESLGTQKYFGLLGPILVALHEKRIFFIDELDSRLHSLLFRIIVDFFNSDKYNSGGAQLVFTSHNTALLKDNLRRDQMVFMEKDSYGASSMSSLYKNAPTVRNDASFERDYLKGLYGAIPSIKAQQLKLF